MWVTVLPDQIGQETTPADSPLVLELAAGPLGDVLDLI